MDRRSGSKRKESRTAAGSGSGCSDDGITALALELHANIAWLLSIDEAVQLTVLSRVLSRAWLHIHLHTPIVDVYLNSFLSFSDICFDLAHSVRGLDEDAVLALRVALGRRAQEPLSSSKVDTLRLVFDIDDRRMRRHAARIVALADARVIRLLQPRVLRHADTRNDVWSLDLPPAARELEVRTFRHLAPAIAGPGAAALRKLRLDHAALTEWPHLPSLVFLYLNGITVEATFAPGELLESFKRQGELMVTRIHLTWEGFVGTRKCGRHGRRRGWSRGGESLTGSGRTWQWRWNGHDWGESIMVGRVGWRRRIRRIMVHC